MSKLVHVKKIEIADACSLGSIQVLSETTCRFKSQPVFSEINIKELVGVAIEDSYENNQKVYTTTATFNTCDKKPITVRQASFRLTSVDGKQYMIGTDSRPYPIIKERNPYPEKPADTTLKTVTITWKSLLPMLLIVE